MTLNISRSDNKDLTRASTVLSSGVNVAVSNVSSNELIKDSVAAKCSTVTKCRSLDNGTSTRGKGSQLNKHSIFNSSLDDISFDSLGKDLVGATKPKSVDIHGVRIVPGVISFENTFENQRYVEKVCVQNISKNCVTIRIYNPHAWSFRILSLEQGYQLAPGLTITRCLHYTCTKTGIVRSSLPIYINDKCFELPLEAYKGQAFVEIVPTCVDFGRVDIGGKAVERKVEIRNISSCATKFLVDLGRSDLDLQVTPVKGWIRPNSVITLRLQLTVMEAGELSSEIWITTDLSQTRIHIVVQACKRSLLVFHPNTTSDFTLIEFPTTFFGCRCYQTIVVYNMAAASSAFVVLADFGNNNLQPLNQAHSDSHVSAQMFSVEPLEGRIRPFEGRIFTIWFHPLQCEKPKFGWKSKSVEEMNDYLYAVRIKRIQADEFGSDSMIKTNEDMNLVYHKKVTKRTSVPNMDILMVEEPVEKLTETPKVTMLDEISVLLCLYGEAEYPSLTVVPDTLYFGELHVGDKENKVIHVTNKSKQKVFFRYNKRPFFDVYPSFTVVEPNKTVDVVVTHNSRNIGALKRKLTFEVLAKNSDEIEFVILTHFTVHITGKVNADTIHPKPKFNHGITPMISHEVGFLTDDLTFLTTIEKPKCAMAAVKDRGRPWLHSDAKIAFPNDRPLTIRPRPIDYSSKTIFKGLTCHIPPVDQTLTYTMEQLLQKKAHDNRMTLYIRGTAAQSLPKMPRVSCLEPGYRNDQPEPPILLFDKLNPNVPQELFVPLTFIQLYRIRASPPLISFGNVTTSKNCSQLLIIENSNNFDVGAKIIPVTPGVSIQMIDNFVLKANSETKITTTFNRENLGKYNGIITCVINGYHSFDIPVVAEVVQKTLVVSPDRVEYRLPEVPFASTFLPLEVNNPLNTPVSFSWFVPEGSPFKIEPHLGMAYKKGLMWCAAYFEPDSPNYKLHPLKLLIESHVCNKLKCGISLPRPNVYFLDPTLNIGFIPFNIVTMKIFVVFNPDFWDAMFVVLNKEPMKGVMVEPHTGIIKARSCFNFILNIKMTTEGPFEFVVYLNIQHSVTIEMKVAGVLEHPHVEVTPKYINLKRMHCHSICRTTLLFQNKSKANAEISFDLKEYPQFKVSLSKKYHDKEISSHGLDLEPETSRKVYLHFIPNDLASYNFYFPVLINGITLNLPEKDIEAHTKMVKHIYQSLSGTTSKKTLFASKLNENLASLVFIDVSVLKPQLTFSSLNLCFLEKSMTKTLVTTNVSEEPLSISFHWDESHTIFKFEGSKPFLSKEKNTLFYKLTPNEDIQLKITLMQASPGTNALDVVVQVAHEEQWIVYNYIRLSATVQKPYIINPSVDVIHFPPVPLEVDISVTIHLTVEISSHLNNQTQIDYEIKGPNAALFKLEFTKGNLVCGSINPTVLPVKITFSSLHPISFKTVIDFSVGNKGKCHIIMTATADNCVLTTHAFLKSHSNSSKVLQDYDDSIDKAEVETSFSPIVDHNMPKRKGKSLGKSSIRKSCSIVSMCSLKTYVSASVNGNKSNVLSSTKDSSQSSGTGNGIQITAVSDIELPLPNDPTDKSTLSSPIHDHIELVGKQNSEEYCFPMYPLEPVVTEYAIHMKQTRCAVQRWIYEQVFHCSYYPILGSHSFSTFVHTKKDYGRVTPVAFRNVFDALERICGRGVRRYFTTLEKLPDDPTARVFFIYNIYKQLIEFLVVQGAFLSHVEPKYLMAYSDYCIYFKMLPSSGETSLDSNSIEGAGSVLLSSSEFSSISIQCWMDVFLQMYKTLILIPTISNKMCPTEMETLKRIVVSRDADFKNKMYSREEEILMAWLTHNYNNQRSVVWPNRPPPERTITNLDTDLEDGLVLAAVTAAYCPYLVATHFYQMFTVPKTVSQAYHNTVCLALAWNRIKLGFSVTPRDFSKPNAVNMLILIVHLYHMLPTYKPESTIKFMATLNSCEIQVVSLENTEDSNVTYNIEILQNSASFSLENSTETFLLKRKQTGKINVCYTARNTTKADAILLLCGACMPPRFGRNYVFRLEGYAVKLPVSAVFNIISPPNAPLTTSICVESPHVQDTKGASYDIWISDTEPQPGNLNALCWAKEKKRKIPRRLFLLTDKLTVEINKRQRTGKLDLRVCCFSQSVHNYWLLFMSEDVGDFIVKLVISPGPPEPTSTLSTLTMDQTLRCYCGSDKSLNCNRTEYIYVPCRNLDQWAAVRTMFELTISLSEQEFWSTYIESHVGYRLLQWMLEEKKEKLNQEIKLLFKKSKTYKVSCKSPYIFCEPLIHVPNVRSKDMVPVKVHFAQDCPNFSTVLTLTSSDYEEIRCYNLDVTSK